MNAISLPTSVVASHRVAATGGSAHLSSVPLKACAPATQPCGRRAALLIAACIVGLSTAFSAPLKPVAPAPASTLAADSARIVIDAQGLTKPAPVFFSASAEQTIQLGAAEITGTWRLKLHVVQGQPEMLSLGLTGDGQIVDVEGSGLREWAVRTSEGGAQRFLDLRPTATPSGSGPRELEVVVHTRLRKPALPGTSTLLLAAPGDAVGFAARITLQPGSEIDFRVTSAQGLVPVGESAGLRAPLQFAGTTASKLEVNLTPRGANLASAEIRNAQLAGQANESTKSVNFQLRGQLVVQKVGAKVRLLSGHAALTEKTAGDGWHIELRHEDEDFFYELVGDRVGTLPVELNFTAAIAETGDWQRLDFRMPAGAVVPLRLTGLSDGVEFDPALPLVPTATATGWQGFLPADGESAVAWKHTSKAAEGALAFTSVEQAEVRVGAGLLRQESTIAFRVLQGKLTIARLNLEGPGEILGVSGSFVLGWSVQAGAAPQERILEVRLSRPFENEGSILVRSQSALASFPVRAQPVRLTPVGAVRHSGYVRVANNGAVRLEVADVNGLMQLAPNQYPGTPLDASARQIFVYRFPSAEYAYRIVATQIQPEVSVSEVVTYELTETDRVIDADLELDIREAPLRDWSLRIPQGYVVVALSGNDVADHAAESELNDGYRTLKILFGRAVLGRQLLKVRLEKNQAAAAGEWRLVPLDFPGAKSVRGHIGAVAAPGYRIVPLQTDRLVEVPLSFFPRQTPGLQQTWRLRETDWTASVRLEALGQSVQADVFHLYSLKEGVVYGSVLLNYFVVGAPTTEWRIEVPESVGNIDVIGQNVRRDWRREGNQVIVALHQPVLGAATLLVTFEQPMSARGGTIHPGEVRALGVQVERGFLQVVSPLQVKHTIHHADGGLLKLEPLELPTEFRLLSSSPSLAVYQYTARPFNFEMGVEWYAQAETVDQVVDFAKLSSQVSRDGQVVTDARFFVKTRGRKALRMVLPAGMKLWEARVDQDIVTARTDGDQTLIPLAAKLNANDPVEVILRLGQSATAAGTQVRLTAPKMSVPVIIDEWTLRGDPERQLVPRGGNAELIRPPLTETGFEWISSRQHNAVGMLFALIAVGGLLLRAKSNGVIAVGLTACVIATAMTGLLAFQAYSFRRPNIAELTYAATMMPTQEALAIEVGNVVRWSAMLSWLGLVAIVAGVTLLILARLRATRTVGVPGAVLLGGGMLAQHVGAVPFFVAIGIALILCLIVPGILRIIRQAAESDDVTPASGTGATAAVSALAVICTLGFGFGGAPRLHAETKLAEVIPVERDRADAAQSMIQRWTIRENRLYAELEVTFRGVTGDSFLLLKPTAVLTDFQGDGVRISKVEHDDEIAYFAVLERDGAATARAKFEMAAPKLPASLPLPTGPAALQRITIDLDQAGWEFASTSAAQVVPVNGPENHSGAVLNLEPGREAAIEMRARQRNVASEATEYFAEAANLFLPGPGVVNVHTRVTIRPAQGRVSAIELEIPAGFTVGDVSAGPVGSWRFDPEKRRLRVAIQPAQSETFRFHLEMQLGTGALPLALSLEPPRVVGATSEVGMIALGFGGDAQPESLRFGTLSPVNVDDFDASLIPANPDGQPAAVIQHAWRYGREAARVELKVVPVAPEVRVVTRQLITLDDDRLVAAVDLMAAITRVGVFKLSLELPAGLEIEALSGPALNHWTEATEGTARIITLHLNGRTLGEQTFNLSLIGPAPHAQDAWAVPRLQVREATRQTGEVLLVPGKGLRLRTVDRVNATQLDPRSVGGLLPGTLAFRLLQDDWTLRIGIESLEPWITTQALQEVTIREGQVLTRIALRYRIENAALKQVRVRLPGLTDDQIRTVRATGSAVSDFAKVSGETEVWEVHFQRGMVGETDLQIEFQGATPSDQLKASVATPVFLGARQTTLFVAVRSSGRLELDTSELPRGWQRMDWSAVPPTLQSPSDRSIPVLCFRVAEPEAPLAVAIRRHDAAEALKLRVTRGELSTLFSPEGASLTAVNLTVDVLEKGTLRVQLPEAARLFATLVNGESVTVVREGDAYLFHVTPNSGTEHIAAVRMVYAVSPVKPGRIALTAPRLSVPLENVAWHVALPPGYALRDYQGALRLSGDRTMSAFGVEEYQALVVSTHSLEAKKATALFEQASVLVRRGEQQQASEVLSRAAKNNALDQASNEDARVQLKELKTQQAVLGLATRRQRLYLDNRGDGARNEQLEKAATLNPFMQGKTNFNPLEVDQLLMGNTVEETSALRGIAGRIVDQQLAAEPAPSAIDVTLPERGRILTFTRSLQVDGTAPLSLTLELEKLGRPSVTFRLLMLGAIAVLGAVAFPRSNSLLGFRMWKSGNQEPTQN